MALFVRTCVSFVDIIKTTTMDHNLCWIDNTVASHNVSERIFYADHIRLR